MSTFLCGMFNALFNVRVSCFFRRTEETRRFWGRKTFLLKIRTTNPKKITLDNYLTKTGSYFRTKLIQTFQIEILRKAILWFFAIKFFHQFFIANSGIFCLNRRTNSFEESLIKSQFWQTNKRIQIKVFRNFIRINAIWIGKDNVSETTLNF